MKSTDKRIKEPCPFCGLPANQIQVETIMANVKGGANRVICPKCHSTFATWDSKEAAINRWNSRFR